ncbi:MAG: folate-binding protein YgfZ [Rhodobacteraceae bacterium]|nr:MAG: folate-binding protein YgfZ [Paracoccaceae bacterium]
MDIGCEQFIDVSRKLIRVSGEDARKFLQGILTNDINKATCSIIYSGILTPQGKYLFDFFVWNFNEEAFVIDIDERRAEDLKSILNLYRLRSDVLISDSSHKVLLGLDMQSPSSFIDPRNSKLGWRKLVEEGFDVEKPNRNEGLVKKYEELRIQLCIPKYGHELIPNESYILELGFDKLNGVSFTKGCFVGQEVTARMKHKTSLKNGIIKFRNAPNFSSKNKIIYNEKGQKAGVMSSSINGMGLGLVKFMYAKGKLICDGNVLDVLEEKNGSV